MAAETRGLIGRRQFLLAGAATTLVAAAPPLDRLAFRVIRSGDVIGSHVLTFKPTDAGFEVQIAVDIEVDFGPLTLFHYTLRGVEQWRDGQVVHVAATTDNDGRTCYMRADRTADGLLVAGSGTTPYLAPEKALPATHWNVAELNGPWINPQDGKLLRPTVARDSVQPVVLADGRSVEAEHYVLSGDAKLEIWYDTHRRWTALRFKAKDGSDVRYELA